MEFLQNRKTLMLWLLVFVGAIISGCATVVPQIQTNDRLAPDKGFVLLKVINNVDRIGIFFRGWQVLRVVNEKEESFVLSPATADVRSAQVFVAQLPPGNYRLVEVSSGSSGALTIASSADIGDKLGSFTVKSDQLTDLGAVIYQPVSKDGYVFLRNTVAGEGQELLDRNYPEIGASLRGKPVLSWNGAYQDTMPVAGQRGRTPLLLDNLIQAIAESGDRGHEYLAWDKVASNRDGMRLAKLNSFSLNDIHQLASGEIFAGSSLGQIVVRDSAGKWSQWDAGTNREITAVKPLDRERVIAGGEEGLLLKTDDSGKTWKRIDVPKGLGVVVFIERAGDNWLVGGLHKNSLSVYQSGDPLGSNWTLSKEIQIDLTLPHIAPRYTAIDDGNRWLLFIPGNNVYAYDRATKTWSQWETPYNYQAIYPIGDGNYVGSAAWGTQRSVFANKALFLSTDNAKTWQLTKANRLVDNPAFQSKDSGYATLAVIGAISASTKIIHTADGGESWEDLGETPTIVNNLFFDRVDKKLYYMSSARIYASPDNRSKWSVVR